MSQQEKGDSKPSSPHEEDYAISLSYKALGTYIFSFLFFAKRYVHILNYTNLNNLHFFSS